MRYWTLPNPEIQHIKEKRGSVESRPSQVPVVLQERAEVSPPRDDLWAAEVEVDGVDAVGQHAHGVLDGAPERLGVVGAELHCISLM